MIRIAGLRLCVDSLIAEPSLVKTRRFRFGASIRAGLVRRGYGYKIVGPEFTIEETNIGLRQQTVVSWAYLGL